MRRLFGWAVVPALFLASVAEARPVAPALFCETYPDAPMCITTGEAPCAMCHTQQPALDPFGLAVQAKLKASVEGPLDDAAFQGQLGSVLIDLAPDDADEDGFANSDEITQGSYPGDASSLPVAPECPSEPIGNLHVCEWDARYAFVRVVEDFCGHRPDYDTLAAFEQASADDQKKAVHDALDECLDTEFWRGRDGQVWQLAHRKVRPVLAIKGLADYDLDYALFAWTQLDDHDVRDVLTAQYLVTASEAGVVPTEYTQVLDVLEGQPLQKDKRAGMLTTTWVLLYNTMFTAVPRTAAAQAYRGYLNLDIAKLQGLEPGAPLPADYDGAGVAADACATCHSTLDPLTYPFSRYNGLQDPPFIYDANRMSDFAFDSGKPNLANVPEKGRLLGQDVADLLEWAEVAANSDQFYGAVVEDYWKFLVGAPPSEDQPEMYAEYEATWQSLKANPKHSAHDMLHTLIDTEAYGAP